MYHSYHLPFMASKGLRATCEIKLYIRNVVRFKNGIDCLGRQHKTGENLLTILKFYIFLFIFLKVNVSLNVRLNVLVVITC